MTDQPNNNLGAQLLADITQRSQIIQEIRRSEETPAIVDLENDSAAEIHTAEQEALEQEAAAQQNLGKAIFQLSDDVFAKWLGVMDPDALLVIMMDAPEELRNRVVNSLSAESHQWLQDNLAMLTRVTLANLRGAWEQTQEAFESLGVDTDEILSETATSLDSDSDVEMHDVIEDIVALLKISEGLSAEERWKKWDTVAQGDNFFEACIAVFKSGLVGDSASEILSHLIEEHLQYEQQRCHSIVAGLAAAADGISAEQFLTDIQNAE